MSKRKIMGLLVFACLALTLAACQAGSGSATGTSRAPINVPSGYQGLIQISFSVTTTYDQAVSIVQNAGLKLQVPCPNPGPIVADPTVTPKNTDQRDTFAGTHELTAVGSPSLTQNMLDQVASASQVISVDKAPPVECPLVS